MFQVRILGRGGQGVVTAAELLSVAAFLEGKYAQAFPSFGPERTGAPVSAFCRIDDRPVRTHEPIDMPDAIVIEDATLLGVGSPFAGLSSAGFVIVNSPRRIEALDHDPLVTCLPEHHVQTVPASDLARAATGRSLPNAALLGALAALTGIVSWDALARAIAERFEGAAREGNVAAAHAAYELVGGGRC
jgi:pyruvate ferredoxin oxidoreductase gamma subunit